MYKIQTLGESFVFLKECDTVKYKYDSSAIIVKADEECDFCFSSEIKPLSKDGFERAVSAYLFKVAGLPSSSYAVRTNYGKTVVPVPKSSDAMFGGSVIKCKPLFAELPNCNGCGGVSFGTVLTECGAVKIAFCDSLSDFDIERVGKHALREETEGRIHSVTAVCAIDGKFSVSCLLSDGRCCADACSCAAAYCSLYSLGLVGEEAEFCSSNSIAVCHGAFGGALVFDKAPSITKIIL